MMTATSQESGDAATHVPAAGTCAAERSPDGIGRMFLLLGMVAVAERAIFFIGMIYSRRVLGATAIGQFSWAAAVMGYFALLLNPGLETVAKREVARDASQAGRYGSALLLLQILLALVAVGCVAVLAWMNPRGQAITMLMLIQAIALLLTPLDLTWLATARGRMSAVAIANVVLQLLQIPMFFLFLHRPSDVYRYALIPYPFRLVLLLYTGWYCVRHQYIDFRQIKFRFRDAVALLREAMPIGLSQVAVLLYYNTDAIFLGIYHGDRTVGLYTTAYKLMLTPTFVFAAAHPAFFPTLSRVFDQPQAARKVSSDFFRLHAWMGLSAAAVTWAVGRYLLVALYGAGFAEEAILYEWLSLNLALIFLNVGLVMPFSMWGWQRLQLKITIGAAVLNVVLNVLLVPRHGAPAAIVTTLLAEAFVLACGAWARYRRVHPIPCHSIVLPPLLAALAVAALMRVLVTIWPVAWMAIVLLGCGLLVAAYARVERRQVVPWVRKLRQGVARRFARRPEATLSATIGAAAEADGDSHRWRDRNVTAANCDFRATAQKVL